MCFGIFKYFNNNCRPTASDKTMKAIDNMAKTNILWHSGNVIDEDKSTFIFVFILYLCGSHLNANDNSCFFFNIMPEHTDYRRCNSHQWHISVWKLGKNKVIIDKYIYSWSCPILDLLVLNTL